MKSKKWTFKPIEQKKEERAGAKYCRALPALVLLILSQPMLFAEGATFPEINCCKQFNQLMIPVEFINSLQNKKKNACQLFLFFILLISIWLEKNWSGSVSWPLSTVSSFSVQILNIYRGRLRTRWSAVLSLIYLCSSALITAPPSLHPPRTQTWSGLRSPPLATNTYSRWRKMELKFWVATVCYSNANH